MKYPARIATGMARLLALLLLTPMLVPGHVSAAPDEETFTISRLRLFVIHARLGASRVDAPMLRGGGPPEIVQAIVESTIEALDLVRRNSDYTDLSIVSQSDYLLQVVRTGTATYRYQVRRDPDATPYGSRSYEGRLSVNDKDGKLALGLSVLRDGDALMQMELLMETGRPVVVGLPQDDGTALFAVLVTDGPEAPPAAMQADPEQERVHLSWDLPPRLIASVKPAYPEIARRAEVEGSVTLYVVVGIDGRVEDVEVMKSTPSGIFDGAAEEAVRQWRYKPAMVDGRPVRARFSQRLQFLLDPPKSGWLLPD